MRVAILGAAQSRHVAHRDDANYAEMVFEVVQDALSRSGLGHGQIDTVVTASSDFWDGRTISDMAVQDAVGGAGKSASKVSMDGAFAMAYGAARVRSGAYSTCLIVAHGKASEGNPRLVSTAGFDPVFERPLGLDDHAALGLEANWWRESEYEVDFFSDAHLADVTARSWNTAAANPNAHRQETRTAAQVLLSAMQADPLRADMIAPDSDGACAVILAGGETGERHHARVWFEGFACRKHPHSLGLRGSRGHSTLASLPEEACTRAGIETRDVEVFEVHDASAAQTIQWEEYLRAYSPYFHPRMLNPSGGAMGAQPGFATGLVRVAEVYDRLVSGKASTGLAHGQTGFAEQAHAVCVLKRS